MCFAMCDLAGAQVPAIVYSATYTSMVKQLSGIFQDIAFTGQKYLFELANPGIHLDSYSIHLYIHLVKKNE